MLIKQMKQMNEESNSVTRIPKHVTKDMITIYFEDGRYHVSKDSRNGNSNYNMISGLTRNDLVHMKQCIDEILRKEEKHE